MSKLNKLLIATILLLKAVAARLPVVILGALFTLHVANADEATRPKIAVVAVENITAIRDDVYTENPSLQSTAIPNFGKDARGITLFGLKRRLDRYQELVRNRMEGLFVSWDEVQMIDRTRGEIIDAELARDKTLGGDRQRKERPLQRTGPTFLVVGTLQQVWRESVEAFTYGETRGIDQTFAEIHLRVLRVPSGEVVFETEATGSFETVTAPFQTSSHSDVAAEAIKSAFKNLSSDPEFKSSFLARVTGKVATPKPGADEVEVKFLSTPDGAKVELDGFYIGETPQVRKFPRFEKHTVRITKAGYEPWEVLIRADAPLTVSAALVAKVEGRVK